MFRKLGRAGWRVSLGEALACVLLAWAPSALLLAGQREVMSAVAGGGSLPPQDAFAIEAALTLPQSVAVDAAGNTYSADKARVTFVDNATGKIQTIAGNGVVGNFVPVNSPATGAILGANLAIALDAQNNLYIADMDNSQILKVSPPGGGTTAVGGNITRVAGVTVNNLGVKGFSGDGGPALNAQIDLDGGFAVSGNGNIYLASGSGSAPPQQANLRAQFDHVAYARKIDAGTADITVTLNGQVNAEVDVGFTTGDGTAKAPGDYQAAAGTLVFAKGVTSQTFSVPLVNNNAQENKYFVVALSSISMNPPDPNLTVGLGTPASATMTIVVGNDSTVFWPANRIRVIDGTNTINTLAGTGVSGQDGDGGPALKASIGGMTGLAVDQLGKLYVSAATTTQDNQNNTIHQNRVRVITPDGNINAVAGNDTTSFTGDGQPATATHLTAPAAVAVGGSLDFPADVNRFLYIGDSARIRVVDLSTGILQTVAGNGSVGDYGDGGFADLAALDVPVSIAVNGSGEQTFADAFNNRVRKAGALPGSGLLTDNDADGFANYIEDAFGSDPNSYPSTPFADVAITDPSQVQKFFSGSIAVRLNFTARGRGRDTIRFTGFFLGPQGTPAVNSKLILDFGPNPSQDPTHHFATVFSVNNRGVARTPKGARTTGNVKLRQTGVNGMVFLKVSLKGEFKNDLATFGLTNGFVNSANKLVDIFPSKTVFVPISVYWPCNANGAVYNGIFQFLYFSKLNKFGSTPPQAKF